MTMGDRIKYLREKVGLTQEELGEKIGVQKSAIRKYEKGEVENIKRSSVKIMADLFGVTASYLMFGEDLEGDAATLATAEERELIRIYRELNATGQTTLIGTARGLFANPDMKKGGTSDKAGTFTA